MFCSTSVSWWKAVWEATHFIYGALSSPANNIFSFLPNVTEYMFNFSLTSEALRDEPAVTSQTFPFRSLTFSMKRLLYVLCIVLQSGWKTRHAVRQPLLILWYTTTLIFSLFLGLAIGMWDRFGCSLNELEAILRRHEILNLVGHHVIFSWGNLRTLNPLVFA